VLGGGVRGRVVPRGQDDYSGSASRPRLAVGSTCVVAREPCGRWSRRSRWSALGSLRRRRPEDPQPRPELREGSRRLQLPAVLTCDQAGRILEASDYDLSSSHSRRASANPAASSSYVM
jgi:hypothetical protein